MLEYAPRGLVGLLTPQANTTAEPETAVLTPPGWSWIAARLRSARPSMDDRLLDYLDGLPAAVGEFANAPLAACAFACTGASYLAGAAREDAAAAELSARHGFPVVTAARAVADALDALGARRIALVSPYGATLEAACLAYWRERGFEPAGVASVFRETADFHPIYTLPSDAVRRGVAELAGCGADAVVVLGTGLPSLRPIAEAPRAGGRPVLSSMLCLAWRAYAAAGAWTADAAGLTAVLDDPGWRSRLPPAPAPDGI